MHKVSNFGRKSNIPKKLRGLMKSMRHNPQPGFKDISVHFIFNL